MSKETKALLGLGVIALCATAIIFGLGFITAKSMNQQTIRQLTAERNVLKVELQKCQHPFPDTLRVIIKPFPDTLKFTPMKRKP